MKTLTTVVRPRRLPVLLLAAMALTAGLALAAEEPKPATPPATETKPKSTPPASSTAPAKTPAKTKAPAAGTAATPPAQNTQEQAAATLRTKGEVVSQTGTMKIGVEANTFAEFPGFDLSKLPAATKDRVVKRANSTYCTCGCKGDTVARCVVTDPTCTLARTMLQEIINRESAAPAPAAAR